jgi:hypothetical protein
MPPAIVGAVDQPRPIGQEANRSAEETGQLEFSHGRAPVRCSGVRLKAVRRATDLTPEARLGVAIGEG